MRSLWKGSVSFGLVNIPIKLYTATEQKSVRFNYLHKECRTPIRYEKVCPTCQRKIEEDEIVRGYEYAKGQYVIINDEDLEGIPLNEAKSIDIVDFVSLQEIDPIYFDRTYFLEPSEGGVKAYYLLRKAMEETGRIAIAKVVLRSRENLAAVRVYQNILVMETMLYPDEIRAVDALPALKPEPAISDNELKMATSLIGNLTEKFAPEKYKDNYREALLEIIEKKVAGEEIEVVPERPAAGKVIDLMAALEASINATKKEKEAEEKTAQVTTKRSQARKKQKAKTS